MIELRHAEPDDHARVAAVVDDWWGGRPMADMLPRLFFVHFRETSFVAEEDGELAGFLWGASRSSGSPRATTAAAAPACCSSSGSRSR